MPSESCQFYANASCTLGLHESKPTEGNCRACMAAGENNEQYAKGILEKRKQAFANPSPSLAAKASSLFDAASQFAINGFKRATAEQLEERLAICKGCDFWNPSGFGGTGSCNKCGCSTQAKLRMASASCPLDPPKWEAIPAKSSKD